MKTTALRSLSHTNLCTVSADVGLETINLVAAPCEHPRRCVRGDPARIESVSRP